jgi:tRNA 2-thiouridine synthesizing protein A
MTDWQHELDASGLLCPLPALKAKRALNAMRPGEILRVRATDPKAPEDLALLCAQSGNEVVATAREGDAHVVYLRRR